MTAGLVAGELAVLTGGGEVDEDVLPPRSTAKTAPAIPSSTMHAAISKAPVHDRRRGGAAVPAVYRPGAGGGTTYRLGAGGRPCRQGGGGRRRASVGPGGGGLGARGVGYG